MRGRLPDGLFAKPAGRRRSTSVQRPTLHVCLLEWSGRRWECVTRECGRQVGKLSDGAVRSELGRFAVDPVLVTE